MTKYYVPRSDGYRLIFWASIAGSVLLFLATVVTLLLLSHPSGQVLAECWHIFVPLKHSGKAALAFLMGALLWLPLNLLGRIWPYLSKEECIRRVIENKQDPLEILLRDAIESDRPISVSVKSGKVYIGRLVSSLDPAYGVQSLTLSRSYSGHRDRETSAFHLDIDYEQVLEDTIVTIENFVTEAEQRIRRDNPTLSEDELEERIEDEFEGWERRSGENEEIRSIVDRLHALEIVIPVAEIQSVNLFDESIYDIVSRGGGGDG